MEDITVPQFWAAAHSCNHSCCMRVEIP